MDKGPDYYAILGVSNDTPQEEIKRAFARKRREYQNDEDALIKINAAYEALGDPEKRREYNDKLKFDEEYEKQCLLYQKALNDGRIHRAVQICLENRDRLIKDEETKREFNRLVISDPLEIIGCMDMIREKIPLVYESDAFLLGVHKELLSNREMLIECQNLNRDDSFSDELKSIISILSAIFLFPEPTEEFKKSVNTFLSDNNIANAQIEMAELERLYPRCYSVLADVFSIERSMIEIVADAVGCSADEIRKNGLEGYVTRSEQNKETLDELLKHAKELELRKSYEKAEAEYWRIYDVSGQKKKYLKEIVYFLFRTDEDRATKEFWTYYEKINPSACYIVKVIRKACSIGAFICLMTAAWFWYKNYTGCGQVVASFAGIPIRLLSYLIATTMIISAQSPLKAAKRKAHEAYFTYFVPVILGLALLASTNNISDRFAEKWGPGSINEMIASDVSTAVENEPETAVHDNINSTDDHEIVADESEASSDNTDIIAEQEGNPEEISRIADFAGCYKEDLVYKGVITVGKERVNAYGYVDYQGEVDDVKMACLADGEVIGLNADNLRIKMDNIYAWDDTVKALMSLKDFEDDFRSGLIPWKMTPNDLHDMMKEGIKPDEVASYLSIKTLRLERGVIHRAVFYAYTEETIGFLAYCYNESNSQYWAVWNPYPAVQSDYIENNFGAQKDYENSGTVGYSINDFKVITSTSAEPFSVYFHCE
ncbi:MAG: J domain-containing protein [Lachnospiraceae bacterium]|nr:J domain-containing protein [Lachnospiraceae bacterium]